jgi:mannosyl-glycoprotein endo-beta-N-acetylglucosaminidase
MVVEPFKSLKELEEWKPQAFEPNAGQIPLQNRSNDSKRRLIVCHDMMGGYKEDNLINGQEGNDKIYTFQYWQLCDVFIYFSHNRISFPPPSWTNCAHRNGVKVLVKS